MNNLELQSVSLLLKRAKEGCQQSREDLIVQLQSYMHLMAVRFTNEHTKHRLGCSDVVQQSVVNVIENFESFRGRTHGEFKSWLKQILLNEVRKGNRDMRREKRDIARERSLDMPQNGIQGSLVDCEPTPESQAIAGEQWLQLRAAINSLAADHARVIRLRSLERLPFKEVAKRMGRSTDATTKLWYRAIIKLQERLGLNDEPND